MNSSVVDVGLLWDSGLMWVTTDRAQRRVALSGPHMSFADPTTSTLFWAPNVSFQRATALTLTLNALEIFLCFNKRE